MEISMKLTGKWEWTLKSYYGNGMGWDGKEVMGKGRE